MMIRKMALLVMAGGLLAVAACTDSGDMKNPFGGEEAFVPTPVPADFAVVVDENHDTYYARQHIQQVVSAGDAMSKTTYTTFRDYNDVVSNKFSQETPLSAVQLQNMWNDVLRYNLLNRSTAWINWLSDADLYKRDTHTIQIRANGQTRMYQQTNGFSGAVRPLMLQIEAVRLPLSHESNSPVAEAGKPGAQATSETQPTGGAPSMEPAK